jgi:molybdenum cofactor cytidylyltransferase
MRAAGVAEIVVVRSADKQGDTLERHLSRAGVGFAINDDPESEMAASIACGVHVIEPSAKAILINPVDHAAVPAPIIRLLIAQWRGGARLVKPVFNTGTPDLRSRGGHPVLVDLSFRGELVNLDPERGLKALFADHVHDVARVAVDSNLIARDMDTWDDYRALHQELFGYEPPTQDFSPAK